MPAMDVPQLILPAGNVPHSRPVHPSPTLDGLRLEVMSMREIGYHNLRFGIDTPYWMIPLGFGDWEPFFGV